MGKVLGRNRMNDKRVKELKHRSHLPEFFPIVHKIDKFSNREQSETDQNDENRMCDYSSEYLRVCFRLYEDSPRPFLNIYEHWRTKQDHPSIKKTK